MRWLLSYGRGTQDIERVTLRIKTNSSGDIYLPTAWYSITGTQDCPYNWYVSIDGWEDTTYAGTGSSSWAIRVWYWLRPWTIHTVTIKPVVDDFLWCRALGYKGSAYAPYLINIISDKSYKGYAFNEIFSWDYYKAYQYQWCTNLLNTDDELLPNTLEIIGNNYRAYEYSWCTSLKNNAEEKILKSVKAIGNNYRAYQYQNCTSMNKIWIRAINRASVGSNYRNNMLSWVATASNPATITIEGGIVEWGSWWLTNNNVKSIKVYKELVSDYQAQLSTITSSKISNNSIWDSNNYEYIEFIALADSNWEVRIPIAWFSTTMSQDCAYDWMISLDGWAAVEYTGTWDGSYFTIGSWLTEWSEHRVLIEPKTVAFWWWRAFWYYSSWAEAYIKQIIHDSYKAYAISTTNTWAHYKHSTYAWCTNLINSYEKLPTSVTTIWDYYMKECCSWCTWLTTAFWEVSHVWAILWTDFRYRMYAWCTWLKTYQWVAWCELSTFPTNYKGDMFEWAGNNMNIYVSKKEPLYPVVNYWPSTYGGWTVTIHTCTVAWRYRISGTLVWTSSNTWFDVVFTKNWSTIYSDTAPDPWSKPISITVDCAVWDVIAVKKGTEQRYWRIDNLKMWYSNPATVDWSRVNKLWCFVDDLATYRAWGYWWEPTNAKIWVWYYDYNPYPAYDINKYTTLVGSYSIPYRDTDSSYSYSIGQWVSTYQNWTMVASQWSYDVMVSWSKSYRNTWTVSAVLSRVWWTAGQSVAVDRWSSYDYTVAWNSRQDGNIRWAFRDYKWNTIIAEWWISSDSATYKEMTWWRGSISINQNYDWWYTANCASRDGRYVWWNGNCYYCPTKWWNVNTTAIQTWLWSYSNMDFSDDGYTAYLSSSFWNITQYTLTAPWDLTTKVSTWKTFNVGSNCNWCFSYDKKYLFLWNWTLRVYQYTE